MQADAEVCAQCGTAVRVQRRVVTLHRAPHCLACGLELESEWTKCEGCGTPVPDYEHRVIERVYEAAPSETSKLALWSAALVVLGLCVPFAPLAAVALGFMAVREINDSDDRLGGRGLATFGLVAGGIFGFAHVLFLIPTLISLLLGNGPGLMALAGGGGEQAGIAGLKKIYEAQSMAHFSAAFDRDEDGIGEYVDIPDLASGSLPFLRKDLAGGTAGGYWLQVVVPEDLDLAERQWWGIALPQNPRKGWRTFVVNNRGVILAKQTNGEQPDLAALDSWEPVDMAVSQFDSEAQESQWRVQEMQGKQTRAMHEFEKLGY